MMVFYTIRAFIDLSRIEAVASYKGVYKQNILSKSTRCFRSAEYAATVAQCVCQILTERQRQRHRHRQRSGERETQRQTDKGRKDG